VKQLCQDRMVRFDKLEVPISAEKFRTVGHYNKGFKSALEGYMSKSGSIIRQSKDKARRIKYQTCYTCREKGHISKDCPKTQVLIPMIVNNDISHVKPKNDTCTINVISSPYDSSHAIWVPKFLLTNHEGPNKDWVPKYA
jgi:hypothetical protein